MTTCSLTALAPSAIAGKKKRSLIEQNPVLKVGERIVPFRRFVSKDDDFENEAEYSHPEESKIEATEVN